MKNYLIVVAIVLLWLVLSIGAWLLTVRTAGFEQEVIDVQSQLSQLEQEAYYGHLDAGSITDCAECNVLVVSMTNVRRDVLGIYNTLMREVSPHLNDFAEESIIFDNMKSVASWTLPVSVSMVTSQYPLDHGVVARSGYWLNGVDLSEWLGRTMIDELNDHGIKTAGFTGNFDYQQWHGAMRNVDHYFIQEKPESLDDAVGRGVQTYGTLQQSIPAFIEWQQEQSDQWFAWVQGFDAHCPFEYPVANHDFVADEVSSTHNYQQSCYWNFEPTDAIMDTDGQEWYALYNSYGAEPVNLSPEDVEYMRALYLGEIHEIDKLFGQLIEGLEESGELDNTVIIVLSEHGDVIGEHGRFMRGGPLRGTFYEEVLHVPFMIRHPQLDLSAPLRVGELTSLIDLAPTVLDIVGIEQPASYQGLSLFNVARGEAVHQEGVRAEMLFVPTESTTYFSELSLSTALYQDQWKLLRESVVTLDNEDKGSQPRWIHDFEYRVPNYYDRWGVDLFDSQGDQYRLYHLGFDPSENTDHFEENQSVFYALKNQDRVLLEQRRIFD